jgi:ATP-dependent Clp protease ATP-binding subunit ClpA
MFDSVSDNVRTILLEKARQMAHETKTEVHPEHIFLSLLGTDCVAAQYLKVKGDVLKMAEAASELTKALPSKNGTPAGEIPFSASAKRVIDQMAGEALQIGSELVGTEHLLMAIIVSYEPIRRLLKDRFDITYGQIREALKPPPESESGVPAPGARQVRINPVMGAVFFASTATAKDIETALFAIEQIRNVQFTQSMKVPTDPGADPVIR